MSNDRINQLQTYNAFIRRKKLTFVLSIAATVLIGLFAVSAGSLEIPIPEVINSFLGKGAPQSQIAVINIRLPRVTAAVVVGAILAVSGAVMQCVLQNPLASASTLGVSQGAAFGAALGIIVFGGGIVNSDSAATAISINNPYIVTMCAFLFGSLSTLVVIILSQFKRDLGPGGLILLALPSALYLTASTLLQYFADETKSVPLCSDFWKSGSSRLDRAFDSSGCIIVFNVVFFAQPLELQCYGERGGYGEESWS